MPTHCYHVPQVAMIPRLGREPSRDRDGTAAEKDTVLIPLPVLGGAGHVQQDQLGILGSAEDHTIEFHGRVHPPDIGMVPVGGG